jgi:hypothetical protein
MPPPPQPVYLGFEGINPDQMVPGKKYNIRVAHVPQPKPFIFVGSDIMNNEKVYFLRTPANENVQLLTFTMGQWINGIIITDNVIGGRRRRSTRRRSTRRHRGGY